MSEYCSVATRAAGQSIVGTAAANTSAWLAIEYHQPWEKKGVEMAEFGPLRARLDAWVEEVEGIRPQLIRHPGPQSSDITAFIGISEPGREQVRRMKVPDYAALAEIDVPQVFAAMRRGETPQVGEPVERPVVLVCTHGKRDRCCAKWGQPVYDALCKREDIELWQTSHLGGHRFAATLLCLPQGICYGWLEPEDANPLVDAHLRGELYRLERLRGRTALSGPGQAAEHFVREATGNQVLDSVRVESVASRDDAVFTASVRVGEVGYQLELCRETLDAVAPPSCGKAPESAHRFALTTMTAV